jgi:hypothetical protein
MVWRGRFKSQKIGELCYRDVAIALLDRYFGFITTSEP